MRTAGFTVLLFVAVVGQAADIPVGEVTLAIANPSGFSPVTEDMVSVRERLLLFVPPASEQLLAFIPDVDVPAALRNETPQLPRRFVVQIFKSDVSRSVSDAEFQELKGVVKLQNAEIIKKAEERLPGLTEKLNKGIADGNGVDLAFSVSKIVPMPVHEETDRTLAYAAFIDYAMNDESGRPSSNVAVVTATFVHVKGKLLLLFSYAEESGLQWSKRASKQWADSIVSANLSGRRAGMTDALPSEDVGLQ